MRGWHSNLLSSSSHHGDNKQELSLSPTVSLSLTHTDTRAELVEDGMGEEGGLFGQETAGLKHITNTWISSHVHAAF